MRGRDVARLPPPLPPHTWHGTFQRNLPVAGAALVDALAPCHPLHAWTACTAWMPPLSLAPPPRTATLQLAVRATPGAPLAPPQQRLDALLAQPGPRPWPEDFAAAGMVALRVPAVVFSVRAAVEQLVDVEELQG